MTFEGGFVLGIVSMCLFNFIMNMAFVIYIGRKLDKLEDKK